jgi:hypothetical protein
MQLPITQIPLNLDNECLKLKDTRIARVLAGKLSLQAFCLTIRPDDWFVLSGDTIYALSPRQWYAMRPAASPATLSKETFEQFLASPPSNLSDKDKATVDYIGVDSKTCPACRYQRHKETVWKLMKKYNLPIETGADARFTETRYPETTEPVNDVLPLDPDTFKGVRHGKRVECIDCVEKHVSQAYVLACETLNGYADYLPLVIGHLCEALDELPAQLKRLRLTLETCLAKTNEDRVPFVPLFALSPLIEMARNEMSDGLENVDQTASNDTVSLDVDEDVLAELDAAESEEALQDVLRQCDEICHFTLEVENPDKRQCIAWEGRMATLGDLLAQFAPKTAAMVRARRLMFVASPALAAEAGYGMDDLGNAVRTSLSRRQA